MTTEDAAKTMAAIDAALAPGFRMTEGLGVVGHHQLHAVLSVVRQAFTAAVYGPPVDGEPVHDPDLEIPPAPEVDLA